MPEKIQTTCYLIEDSRLQVDKISSYFKEQLNRLELKWVSPYGMVSDKMPHKLVEYKADRKMLESLENINDTDASIFLVGMSLNREEDDLIYLEEQRKGTFKPITSAGIIRKLIDDIKPARIIAITSINGINSIGDCHSRLRGLPEEKPLTAEELQKVGFLMTEQIQTPCGDVTENEIVSSA
jgi:hypothetical protein